MKTIPLGNTGLTVTKTATPAAGVKKGCCGTLPGSVQPVSGGILWASANP